MLTKKVHQKNFWKSREGIRSRGPVWEKVWEGPKITVRASGWSIRQLFWKLSEQ